MDAHVGDLAGRLCSEAVVVFDGHQRLRIPVHPHMPDLPDDVVNEQLFDTLSLNDLPTMKIMANISTEQKNA